MLYSAYGYQYVPVRFSAVKTDMQERTKMELQYEKDSKERIPYEHYMELFQKADPAEISARTGIPYDKQSQTFNLHLLGVAYQVHFPDYVVTHDPESTVGYYPLEAAINARILVLRYLVEGHSAPSTGKYLTYRETPWGTVYLKQFQGRCLMRLAYGFGNKQELPAKSSPASASYQSRWVAGTERPRITELRLLSAPPSSICRSICE